MRIKWGQTVVWMMLGLSLGGTSRALAADDFERAPINYTTATPNNAVSRLQDRLSAGKARLDYGKEHGFLQSLLKGLNVPESSQLLVFSKTSMQRHRIAPKSPRALYFNDDVYIGFCQFGNVLEISAVDPSLGTVFYTLNQDPEAAPKFKRQDDSCLLCHASSQTRGVPGHLVRSVFADTDGSPILSSGTFRIDQTSPIERRWGGWYVTGTHGKQTHLGNLIVKGKREPEQIDNKEGQNLTSLKDRFDTSAYLNGHSDIVALLVLEHQAEMHNLITRANFQTRRALHDETLLNKELKRPDHYRSATTWRRIKSVTEPLVKYLLFSGEARLTAKVQGTSAFAAEFAKQGPRDAKGRSLRDFDLERRIFKYPCSYLIYSEAFAALPDEARSYVYQDMWEILKGHNPGRDYDHLSADDRQAILEILLTTKKDLPDYWQPSKQ
jgi:hypothetical protein